MLRSPEEQRAYDIGLERLAEWRYHNARLRDRQYTRQLQRELHPKGKQLRKARRQYAEHVLKTAGTFDAFLEAKRLFTAQCAERSKLQRLIGAADTAPRPRRRWQASRDPAYNDIMKL
jgi:hypothetical protein